MFRQIWPSSGRGYDKTHGKKRRRMMLGQVFATSHLYLVRTKYVI